MDDLIPHLPKDKNSPRLWFERLLVFSEPSAEKIVQDVPFRRGVNVVWAKEPAAGRAKGLLAAGHGVGKTSLCLLLRFCMGDPSKAVVEFRDELFGEFPKGGVAAVVHVEGQPFTLVRYFNSHKDGAAFAGNDTDDIWSRDVESSDRDFLKRLASDMMRPVSPSAIPDTGQAIEWRHVLAWISRDQGSRFKSFFAWREGEGLGLQRSRQDPPLVMRAVLGLVDESESNLMNQGAALEASLAQAVQKEEELHREPTLIKRRIESNLRAMGSLPDDLPIRADDLFGDSVQERLKVASEDAAERLAQWELKQDKADQDLAEFRAELKLRQGECERAEAEYNFAEAAQRGDEQAYSSIGAKLLQLKGLTSHCEEGNIPFSQCSYVNAEIKKLEQASLLDHRDKKNLQNAMAESASRAVTALARKDELKSKFQKLERQEAVLKSAQNKVRLARRTTEVEASKWPSLLEELARWDSSSGSAKAQADIESAQAEIASIERELAGIRTKLALLHQGRSSHEKSLAEITDSLTKRLLPDGAFGLFDPRDEDRPFRLSMRGGEAYRVLEVLLGDVACMLDSADSRNSLPGLLIHDCPREADMSVGLYENFLSLMGTLEKEEFAESDPPFQYIVTTTTPPPTNLRGDAVCLELDPSSAEGLLFGRRFGSEQQSALN